MHATPRRGANRLRLLVALAGAVIVPLSGWSSSPAVLTTGQTATSLAISLRVSSPKAGQVQLTWTETAVPYSIEVERNGYVIAHPASGTTAYLDQGLAANKTYTYQVVGLSQLGTVTSASNKLSIDPDGPTGSGGSGGPLGIQQNWPCTGCIVSVPATYNPRIPTALLVALHGDEGISTYIANTWMPVTQKANVILFAPQCPTSLGCRFSTGNGTYTNSWWGWLQYSPTYDDAWIANQVRLIEAKYDIDRAREYITGWSGGADYLGWYALTHTSRFPAANFVVGGVPYTEGMGCPSRKLAAYFLMGSNDFRYQSGQPSQVQQILSSCGDPTKMVVLAGADHQGTIDALSSEGYAKTILSWMMSHILAGSLPS